MQARGGGAVGSPVVRQEIVITVKGDATAVAAEGRVAAASDRAAAAVDRETVARTRGGKATLRAAAEYARATTADDKLSRAAVKGAATATKESIARKRVTAATMRGATAYAQAATAARSAASSQKILIQQVMHARTGMMRLASGIYMAERAYMALRRGIQLAAKPVGLATTFEYEFAQIRTLTSEAGEDLRKQLLDLAERVPQTASDITKAAYQAISASVRPEDTAAFLDAASKTAVAGATSLTEAVDLLTATTNAYAESGLTATEAADTMFATVRQGKTTIGELTSTIGQAASGGAAFGVSLQELGAGISTLTKGGLETSEAVTQLNSVIKHLAKPTGEAKKKLDALGVSYGIGALRAKGLTGVLEELRVATGGNVEVLGDLFIRQEATKGLLRLMSGDMAVYKTDLESITGATGDVSAANEIMAATTKTAIDLFKAQAESVLRQMGEVALPAINDLLVDMGAYLDEHGDDMIEATRDLVESLVGIGRWAADHGGLILSIIEGMIAGRVVSGLYGLATAIRGVGAAALTAGGGIVGMGKAIGSSLASPGMIGPAVAGAYVLGQAIGDAIGEAATASYRRQASELEREIAGQAARLDKMLRERGVGSMKELAAKREAVMRGELLTDERGQFGTFGEVLAGARTVGSTPASEAAAVRLAAGEQAQRQRMEAARKRGQAQEQLAALADARQAAAQRAAEARAAAQVSGVGVLGLAGPEATMAQTAAARAERMLRDLDGEQSAARASASALDERADALDRAARATERNAEAVIAAQRDMAQAGPRMAGGAPPAAGGARAVAAETGSALSEAWSLIGHAVSDAGALVGAWTEAQIEQIHRREEAERTDAERRALLIEDDTARELELLRLRHADEYAIAEEAGQSLAVLAQLQAQERNRIVADSAVRQKMLWKQAGAEVVNSVAGIASSLEAMGLGSQRIEGLVMAARGIKAQADAIDLAGEAYGYLASYQYPSAIAAAAGAAAKQAAAAAYFAGAAKLGAGGGASAPSAPSVGGGAGGGAGEAPRRRELPRSSPADEPTTYNIALNLSGPVTSEDAGDAIIEVIDSALRRRGARRLDRSLRLWG